MMFTYIIGDVHGCYNTLQNLIKKLPKNSDLIFVGDLCDRGKYSKDIIEFVLGNNYRCIKGNHEKYMINHLENVLFNNEDDIRWLTDKDGGSATVDSYKNTNKKMVLEHLSWLKNLPSYFLIDDTYFITHGYGLPFFQRKDNDDEKIKRALMSNRINEDKYKPFWENTSDYKIINIFGHCRFKEVLIGKNYYGIDTGCAYGNKLTAIELGSMSIVEENLDVRDA